MKGKKEVLQRKNRECGIGYFHPISFYRIRGDGTGK